MTHQSDADLYQNGAIKTAGHFTDFREKLAFAAMEVNAEAGELANLVYKHLWQGHELDKEKVIGEVGDVLWGLAVVLDAIGTNLSTAMAYNQAKLAKRYPSGVFTVADSLARADTQPDDKHAGFTYERDANPTVSTSTAIGKALEADTGWMEMIQQLDHSKPPFVADSDGDAPGPWYFGEGWVERAYAYQKENGLLRQRS